MTETIPEGCSYLGCPNRHHAKGFCKTHYIRWSRHGDPDKRLRAGNADATRYLLDSVLPHADTDACLIWPYHLTKDGRGRVVVDGRQTLAHRVVCSKVHGPAPTPLHEAAHSCGRGDIGCVNPHHLSWKTRLGNEADKRLHGTIARGERNARAKLTAAGVLEIRALQGRSPQSAVAARFNVAQSTISAIWHRKKWAWL